MKHSMVDLTLYGRQWIDALTIYIGHYQHFYPINPILIQEMYKVNETIVKLIDILDQYSPITTFQIILFQQKEKELLLQIYELEQLIPHQSTSIQMNYQLQIQIIQKRLFVISNILKMLYSSNKTFQDIYQYTKLLIYNSHQSNLI